MNIFKKRVNEFPTPYTCTNAVKKRWIRDKTFYDSYGIWKYRTWADNKRAALSGG